MSRRLYSLWFALLLCGHTSGAQTLAHPGWRGNGIASEAWWKHGAFVRFPAETTFTQAAEAMDAMSQAGADSIILPDLQPPGSAQANADSVTQPFDGKFGSEDDLDALLREASARRMHVLLRADLLRLAGNQGELRFWMSRGISGFDLGTLTSAQLDTLQLLHNVMDRFPGRRILLAHVPESSKPVRGRQDPVTLHLLSTQEFLSHQGTLQTAVEVQTADTLTTQLPPNAAFVLDSGLLADEATREAVRRTIAAQVKHAWPYSGARSSRARSGRRLRRRSR